MARMAASLPVRLLAAAICCVVAACAYRGGGEHPVIRKFTWFSYLNGDDIRGLCREGAPPQYRFVYNGVYIRQVRTYDIEAGPPGSNRHRLTTRVIGRTDVSRLELRSFGDLFAPGRGEIRDTWLTDADLQAFDAALVEGGLFLPAPAGERLAAEDFFWTAVACVDGKTRFNAYKWPSQRFAAAAFPSLLLAWDPTGIPLARPRELSLFDIYGTSQLEEANRSPRFVLTVGENGLVGFPQ